MTTLPIIARRPKENSRYRLMADAIAFLRVAQERGDQLKPEHVEAVLECTRRSAYRWIRVWHSHGGTSAVRERT